MVLESVSDRVNGEVPDADELNELKDALFTLLNTSGLPSSSLDWSSFEAQGNINMAGFSLQNLGNAFGEIHVNAAKTLATAVGEANAAGGGDIVVDSGYAATVPASGLTVSADNVRIRSQGGATISFANLTSAGAGITVTGDNFKFVGNSCICAGDGTNLSYAIRLSSVTGANVSLNYWDGMTSSFAVYAASCDNATVTQNFFNDSDKTFLLFEGGQNCIFDDNYGHDLQANGVLIAATTAASADYHSISGNIGYKAATGGAVINIQGAASPESNGWCVQSNRVYSPGNTAITVGNIHDGDVSGNIVDGDMYVYGADACTVHHNKVSETFTLTNIEGSTKVHHNFADDYSFPGTEATMAFDYNHSVQALTSPTCFRFVGNTSDASVSVSTGVDVYHSNGGASGTPVASRQTYQNGINIVGVRDFYADLANVATNDQITATVMGFSDYVKGEVKEIEFLFEITSATNTLTLTVNGVSLAIPDPTATALNEPFVCSLKLVSISASDIRWIWKARATDESFYESGLITGANATALYAASTFDVVLSHFDMNNSTNKFGMVLKGANV